MDEVPRSKTLLGGFISFLDQFVHLKLDSRGEIVVR